MLPANWLEQLQEEPKDNTEEDTDESSRSSVNAFQQRPRVAVPAILQHRASSHPQLQPRVLQRRPPPLRQRATPTYLTRTRVPLASHRRKSDTQLSPNTNRLRPNATRIPVKIPPSVENINKASEAQKQNTNSQTKHSQDAAQEKAKRIIQELRQTQRQHQLQKTQLNSLRKVTQSPQGKVQKPQQVPQRRPQ